MAAKHEGALLLVRFHQRQVKKQKIRNKSNQSVLGSHQTVGKAFVIQEFQAPKRFL